MLNKVGSMFKALVRQRPKHRVGTEVVICEAHNLGKVGKIMSVEYNRAKSMYDYLISLPHGQFATVNEDDVV